MSAGRAGTENIQATALDSAARAALAREAILYTLPLYEMTRMQSASSPRRNRAGAAADPDAAAGPQSTWRWVNFFSHTRHLLGPQDRRVVTPNNDTLYTNAWLDLSHGPLLIHTPDTEGRYYVLGFLDFWTNPFAHAGTRTTGTGAQTLFVHGPQWQGEVPAGATRIAAPTSDVWILGRILATAQEDLAPVHALQDQFRITPAARAGAATTRRGEGANTQQAAFAGDTIDTTLAPSALPGDPATYARVINRALLRNPPPADEAQQAARFEALGIGARFAAGTPSAQAADLAWLSDALKTALAELDQPQPSRLGGGWSLPVRVRESFGQDWLLRARVARGYIGALGIEEAMYPMADVDEDGAPLDGRHRYTLRFAPDALPQVDAFWSLTMYRKSDYLLVDNPLHRYSIGDRTPGLQYDADGGLTIALSHLPPPSGGSAASSTPANWLPAPDAAFYLTLRLYLPRAAHLNETFVYPPIKRAAARVG